MDFFDVSGADAAGSDADEEFVAADARHGDSFGDEMVGAAVNGGAHGFRYREHAELLTQRGKGAKEERSFKDGEHEAGDGTPTAFMG
jgi:hypothetical protein